MDWTACENAIFAWIRQATGLAEERVLWAARHPIPDGAYASLRVIGLDRFGRDWSLREPAGADDIQHSVRGLREIALEVQLIAGGELGPGSCVALLEKVVSAAELPSVRAALVSAKIGVLSSSNVRFVAAEVNRVFEPRAIVEFALIIPSELTETIERIKHVKVEGTVEGQPVSTWTPEPPPP